MGIEAELSARPVPASSLSLAGSLIEAEFDSDVTNTAGAIIAGMREGNRLPTVPKFQMAATATYTGRLNDTSEWFVSGSYQHVGSRYTQPGDQEPGAGNFTNAGGNSAIFFDPQHRRFRHPRLQFRLAQAAGLRSGKPLRRAGVGQRLRA